MRQVEEKGDQAFLSDGRFKPGDNRVGQLMRENRRLREERDILKKAVAILSG